MPNPPTAQFPLPAVSLTDILTTFKLLVQAVNNWSTTELDINGNQSLSGITSATLVKASPGRVVTLSVIVAGAAGTDLRCKLHDGHQPSDLRHSGHSGGYTGEHDLSVRDCRGSGSGADGERGVLVTCH